MFIFSILVFSGVVIFVICWLLKMMFFFISVFIFILLNVGNSRFLGFNIFVSGWRKFCFLLFWLREFKILVVFLVCWIFVYVVNNVSFVVFLGLCNFLLYFMVYLVSLVFNVVWIINLVFFFVIVNCVNWLMLLFDIFCVKLVLFVSSSNLV